MTDLNPKQHKFIDEYIHCRNEESAALSAGYKGFWGKRLKEIPAIAEEIEKRLNVLHVEQAKETIKKRELCKDLIDGKVAAIIGIDIEKIIEKPALGATVMQAVREGYGRIGIISGGEYVPDADIMPTHKPDDAPRIFIAQETKILTHKIETTQQVTRTVESSPYDF